MKVAELWDEVSKLAGSNTLESGEAPRLVGEVLRLVGKARWKAVALRLVGNGCTWREHLREL